MAVIPVKSFSGMIPRAPAHLLDPNQAQLAVDCNLSHGELRPLNGPFLIKSLANAAKGLYSEDGIVFFSWPNDTRAFRGPVVTDQYHRIYYSGVNQDFLTNQAAPGVRVCMGANMSVSGGPPPSNADFLAGVPASAFGTDGKYHLPVLTANDLDTIPGVPNANVVISFWYEDAGQQYQYTSPATYTTVKTLRQYTITAPARSTTAVTSSNPTGTYAQTITQQYVDGQGTTQTTDVTVNGDISIPSANTVIANNVTYTGVVSYTDSSGVSHDLSATVSSASDSKSTPDGSTPQAQITVTNSDTKEMVFQASTSTATGGSTSSLAGNISVALAKVDGTDNQYTLTVTYGVMETRAYVYTNVNVWGEESVASDAALINVNVLQSVTVQMICIPWPGYQLINRMRIYRSNTSNTGATEYQFVGEVDGVVQSPTATYSFTDTVTGEQLGEVLPSDLWDCPLPTMTNLTLMPNGVFAASWQNNLYFSVPYQPWAWPRRWAIVLPYNITGIMAHGNSLLVTTTAYPYLVNGSYPDSFTSQRMPVIQAGIWQGGTTDLGYSLAYMSHDGIVMYGMVGFYGERTSLEQSEHFFTRDDWRAAYGPSISNFTNMRLTTYDGRIMGLRPPGSTGFLIDMQENGAMTQLSSTAGGAAGAFVLPQTDQCYITDNSGNLYQMFGGSALTYTWWSKDFIVDRPCNFGALQLVLADGSGSVTYTVYADGVAQTTGTISASGIYRLNSGFKGRRWSVKLTGTATVREMYLANTPYELQNV